MMNNLIPRVGLGALIFNRQNQILLGKRMGSHGSLTWAPPGGHLEFGESFEAGIIREVLEETSLVITKPEFVGMTNDFFAAENKHYISIFMRATFDGDQEVKNCEPHKIKEWRWFDLENLPESLFLPLRQLLEGNYMGSDANQCRVLF